MEKEKYQFCEEARKKLQERGRRRRDYLIRTWEQRRMTEKIEKITGKESPF